MTGSAPTPSWSGGDLAERTAAALERLTTAVRRLLTVSAAGQGLSPIQQQALLALSRAPADRRQVGALAAEFGVSQPTMSDAITALERKQLLTRQPTNQDARRRELRLTLEGDHVVETLAGWNAPLIGALRRQEPSEVAAMLEATLDLIARLYAAGVVTVDRSCTTCRFFQPKRHANTAAPHHCTLLDMPLGGANLRSDCPEHQPDPR